MTEEKTWNQQLSEWYSAHGSTQKVKEVGLAKTTFKEYKSGKITNLEKVSSTNKTKLYALTGLDIFKVEGGLQTAPTPAALARQQTVPIQKKSIDNLALNEVDSRVKEIAGLFYDMVDKLDYFKDCPEEHRTKLTQRLCEEDIGYLTSLLTAIYVPSKFKAWVLRTNYRPRRKYH